MSDMHPHSSPQQSPRHSISAPAVAAAAPSDAAATIAQLQAQVMQLYQMHVASQQQNSNAAAPPAPSGASSHGPSVKISNPSPFKGEMGFAVDDWLGEMQQQFAYYDTKFPDDASRIRYAAAFLRGPALQWWNSSSVDQTAITSWDEFTTALHKRFRPVQAPMIARQRLDKLRQRTGQSVNQYVNQFQTTMTPITDMGDADQVHHFVNGLLPSIAGKVWERHPDQLKDAIDYAVSIEAMSNFGRASAPAAFGFGNRSSNGTSSASSSAPMDLNHIGDGSNDNHEGDSLGPRFHDDPSASRSDPALQAMLTKMETLEHRVLAMANGGGRNTSSSSLSSSGRRGKDYVEGLKPGEIDQLMQEQRCFRCKGKGHRKADPVCPKYPKSAPRSVNW